MSSLSSSSAMLSAADSAPLTPTSDSGLLSHDGVETAAARGNGSSGGDKQRSAGPSDSPRLQPAARSAASRSRSRSQHALGLCFLCCVIVLWVGSSALIQWIFSQQDAAAPFFLTYCCTALFILYLPCYSCWRAGEVALAAWKSRRKGSQYSRLNSPAAATVALPSLSAPTPSSSSSSSSRAALWVAGCLPPPPPPAASVRAHAQLALLLSPIWFLMEYLYNVSLSLTSLSHNSILSTSSGAFVLLLSAPLFREPVSCINVLGIALTFAGSVMVYADGTVAGEAVGQDREEAGGDGEGSGRALLGDLLAVLAALCYALYTVVVRWKVRDEAEVNWQLVLGFLGLVNAALTLPLFPILAVLQLEPVVVPSAAIVVSLVVNGLLGTVLADYLWARSIVLTSPLVATMGLTLNIPASLLLDWLWRGAQGNGALYAAGGAFVVVGFVLVNWKEAESRRQRAAGSALSPSSRHHQHQQQEEEDDDEAEAEKGGGRAALPLERWSSGGGGRQPGSSLEAKSDDDADWDERGDDEETPAPLRAVT